MKPKPTLTQGEIPEFLVDRKGVKHLNPQYPLDRICKTGHVAPLGTRFFSVTGPAINLANQGIYCEHCLAIANRMSRLLKHGLPITFDPQKELRKMIEENKMEAN